MHTQLMKSTSCNQGYWPCNLDYDLETKIAILDCVALGGSYASQTHLFFSLKEIFDLEYSLYHISGYFGESLTPITYALLSQVDQVA